MAVGVVGRRLGLADDDEPAVGGGQHLDRRAVEPAERLGGDDVAWCPGNGADVGVAAPSCYFISAFSFAVRSIAGAAHTSASRST